MSRNVRRLLRTLKRSNPSLRNRAGEIAGGNAKGSPKLENRSWLEVARHPVKQLCVFSGFQRPPRDGPHASQRVASATRAEIADMNPVPPTQKLFP